MLYRVCRILEVTLKKLLPVVIVNAVTEMC